MEPLTDEIKFQALTLDCSDSEFVDLLKFIPEDIRYEHRARFEWLMSYLTAADALATAGEKAENALGLLIEGPGYHIAFNEETDPVMAAARAALRELSAALRQYEAAADA